jgi:phosphatidylserine/phosphatidylglycerophosphate/cardiolipin synthase-like enzyme
VLGSAPLTPSGLQMDSGAALLIHDPDVASALTQIRTRHWLGAEAADTPTEAALWQSAGAERLAPTEMAQGPQPPRLSRLPAALF